ncbi:PSP1-domain-containing protein [Macrolepiota fuliginosa MF-IS2]|uniref:PSP1-domain-containing protein n=1 Tax=Macrolepiota fuliginosa MF-IS2 TaxID=1400762 RepID=A0A9P6BXC0_9AGAR|nr:PSP1-domain-containing protein [Macrolepiota fuliginosa MF-IS2]
MAQNPIHHFGASDDDDRRSRFAPSNGFDGAGTGVIGRGSSGIGGGGPVSLRERAASQPPHSPDQNFLSSPSATHFIPSSLGGGTAGAWPNSRLSSGRGNQPIPIRSSSFSQNTQSQFLSAMRDRAFPSMIEDDEESDALSDTYDDRLPLGRGRSYGQDPTRSRSQSLATGRPVGYFGSSTMNSWNDSFSTTSPLAIPGRYGEIKPPGASRYGSLGTLGRSPSNLLSSSPSANLLGNGLNSRGISETNQSPFRRDVGQIFLDEPSALWTGPNPPRDENGGGGSGTTSRRHSVSIVQPRKGIIGFNAPSVDGPEEPIRSTGGGFGRGNLKLTDDDLASDLGMLNLGSNDAPLSATSTHPPSQPASLPIYAPLSRSPPSRDLLSPYQSINTLGIPSSYSSRQPIGTPSESEFPIGGDSPSKFDQYQQYGAQQQETSARFNTGQFKFPSAGPGGGGSPQIPYLRNREPSFSSNAPPGLTASPISPTAAGGSRLINPQQQPFYAHQIQRKISEPLSPLSAASASQPPSASTNLTNPPLPSHGQHQHQGSQHSQQSSQSSQSAQPNINDLGRGVPLHSVPPSCPLFIVEFKAGRTDLFYLIDPSVDVKTGDLVIVEADRGKDLGTVVNDTITIGQVEEWQRQQADKAAIAAAAAAAAGFGMDGPLSPTAGPGAGGPGSGGMGAGASAGGGTAQGAPGAPQGKKEINPKMILGKADQQDTAMFQAKAHDEMKALQLCQSKVKAKKLPMEVIDAEYQWDRRKLTFYFIAEKRIDFRELVRELFRLYKTRIWMASIQGGGVSYEQ